MKYTTPGGAVYNLFLDMNSQAHLLIAGASGSGKSVLVNGLICTALHRFPGDADGSAEFILIDPKRVELSQYRNLPHVLRYSTEPVDMVDTLRYAIALTESRYKRMERCNCRKYWGSDVYVIIEELADLMTTNRREVQPLIQRLCQIGRAAKVHVWAITQTPVIAVIPTPIRVNFDGIVALRTRSAQDSRNIIGQNGAETLPRFGECLFVCPERRDAGRWVVPYIRDTEQMALINWWESQSKKRWWKIWK